MPDFPHQLIRQLQIRTRLAAGLPQYDPDDPTLPVPPSLATTIASLNHHTQSDLRCDNCKGKFLRGIQSNTCVYCGKHRLNDVVQVPICFVSTTGYRWLLRYLSLDGSEMVKPPTVKTKRDQRKRSPGVEIHLSDFLNVKVTWESVTNKKETTVLDELAEENTRFFTLAGFAPDDFFFKFNKDASITSNELITHDQIPHDNQDLFQTFHSSDIAGVSLEDKNTEPLSGWEADFQFADSSTQQGFSSSSDPFMGTSTEPANKVQDSESLNSFPGFSDLNSDEQGNIPSTKDEDKSDGPNDLSTSVNFFDDFEWQASNTYAPENLTVGEENKTRQDSFNDWDDFIGSSSLQDSSQKVGNESNAAPISDKKSAEMDMFNWSS